MAGYCGYSMSNNAIDAYRSGEKPFSKWTKCEIIKYIEDNDVSVDLSIIKKIPVKVLKDNFLTRTSWHHTSNHYNKTDFYSVDIDRLEEITNEELIRYTNIKTENKKEDEEKWKCRFLEWSGTRKHPKAIEIIEIGIVRGEWFYRADGTKKKTSANGFRFIEKL